VSELSSGHDCVTNTISLSCHRWAALAMSNFFLSWACGTSKKMGTVVSPRPDF
jgi:hypothetical protein